MPHANINYPKMIHPFRWARNGQIPDAYFLRQLVTAQNHALAYRRKTFFRWGDFEQRFTGISASTVIWRVRCHTGLAATKIGIIAGMGRSDKGSAGDPIFTFRASKVAGGSDSVQIHAGASLVAPTDVPSEIIWRDATVDVDPDADYELDLTTEDYARPLSVLLYEIANPEVDEATNYYVEAAPTIEQPVYDATHLRILQGMSEMWRRNGRHLLSWGGSGTGTNPTFNSTTWTNVIDGSTSVSASTPGYYFHSDEEGEAKHIRVSDTSASTVNVVLAVHCSVTGSATGEVRLQSTGGTAASITGMGTASAWYTTTTTITTDNLLDKLDLQCRTSNGANTVTLNAVSLYTYLA